MADDPEAAAPVAPLSAVAEDAAAVSEAPPALNVPAPQDPSTTTTSAAGAGPPLSARDVAYAFTTTLAFVSPHTFGENTRQVKQTTDGLDARLTALENSLGGPWSGPPSRRAWGRSCPTPWSPS